MNKDEILVPASTIDVSLDSNMKSEDGSEITHLHQIPFFQQFSIEELRYYDYLKEGYVSVVKSNETHSFQQNQFNQFQGFNQSSQFEEPITYHHVSPWSIQFPSVSEVNSFPQSHQEQPYGAIPDSQINYQNQSEQENLPNQQQSSINYDSHPSFFNQFNY